MIFDRLRPWLWPAVVLVGVGLLVVAWNKERGLVRTLERERDEIKIARTGAVVEAQKKERDLKAEAEQLRNEYAALNDLYKKLQGEVDGMKPVEIIRWRTKPGAAEGKPLPIGASMPACPDCLLVVGNEVDIRAGEITYSAPSGARAVTVAAECWRLTPTETMLFSGSVSAPLSSASVQIESTPLRWGVGGMGFAGRDGWAAGPALAFPPVRVLSFQFEAISGAGVGPSGAWQVGATGIVRW